MMKWKRKYVKVRKEFKEELKIHLKDNPALAMAIINTHRASRYRSHIIQIWEFLGLEHRGAYNDYCNKLAGKCLAGEDTLFDALFFCSRNVYDKYRREIPEDLAMGDALGLAYYTLKKAETNAMSMKVSA